MAKQKEVKVVQYSKPRKGIFSGCLVKYKGQPDKYGYMMVLGWNDEDGELVVITDDGFIMGVQYKEIVRVKEKNVLYWATILSEK